MKITASVVSNLLKWNIRKLLLPSFGQKIIILSYILLNSILIYLNKNIVNNNIDYKSISIFVTQKKGMPVLNKRGASFKLDIIMVAYKLIIYLNILVYKLKQSSHRLRFLHVISK